MNRSKYLQQWVTVLSFLKEFINSLVSNSIIYNKPIDILPYIFDFRQHNE